MPTRQAGAEAATRVSRALGHDPFGVVAFCCRDSPEEEEIAGWPKSEHRNPLE